MLDLINRLEQAETGSRDLDLEIWGNHVAVPRSPRPWKLNVTPPAYTTSIDAAVFLISTKLPGADWHLDVDENRICAWVGGARVWASTPALALCAALFGALLENSQ